MSAVRWSWIKYLKISYHQWKVKRLVAKADKMMKRITELQVEMRSHMERAEELVREVEW